MENKTYSIAGADHSKEEELDLIVLVQANSIQQTAVFSYSVSVIKYCRYVCRQETIILKSLPPRPAHAKCV